MALKMAGTVVPAIIAFLGFLLAVDAAVDIGFLVGQLEDLG